MSLLLLSTAVGYAACGLVGLIITAGLTRLATELTQQLAAYIHHSIQDMIRHSMELIQNIWNGLAQFIELSTYRIDYCIVHLTYSVFTLFRSLVKELLGFQRTKMLKILAGPLLIIAYLSLNSFADRYREHCSNHTSQSALPQFCEYEILSCIVPNPEAEHCFLWRNIFNGLLPAAKFLLYAPPSAFGELLMKYVPQISGVLLSLVIWLFWRFISMALKFGPVLVAVIPRGVFWSSYHQLQQDDIGIRIAVHDDYYRERWRFGLWILLFLFQTTSQRFFWWFLYLCSVRSELDTIVQVVFQGLLALGVGFLNSLFSSSVEWYRKTLEGKERKGDARCQECKRQERDEWKALRLQRKRKLGEEQQHDRGKIRRTHEEIQRRQIVHTSAEQSSPRHGLQPSVADTRFEYPIYSPRTIRRYKQPPLIVPTAPQRRITQILSNAETRFPLRLSPPSIWRNLPSRTELCKCCRRCKHNIPTCEACLVCPRRGNQFPCRPKKTESHPETKRSKVFLPLYWCFNCMKCEHRIPWCKTCNLCGRLAELCTQDMVSSSKVEASVKNNTSSISLSGLRPLASPILSPLLSPNASASCSHLTISGLPPPPPVHPAQLASPHIPPVLASTSSISSLPVAQGQSAGVSRSSDLTLQVQMAGRAQASLPISRVQSSRYPSHCSSDSSSSRSSISSDPNSSCSSLSAEEVEKSAAQAK